MVTLEHYLTVAAVLFVIGIFGLFLNRKNIIILLMSTKETLSQADAHEGTQPRPTGPLSLTELSLAVACSTQGRCNDRDILYGKEGPVGREHVRGKPCAVSR